MSSKWGFQPKIRKLDAVILHGGIHAGISLQDTQPDRIICAGLVPGVITAVDDSTGLSLYHLVCRGDSLCGLVLDISTKLTGKAKIAIGIIRDGKRRRVAIALGLDGGPRIGRPPLVVDHVRRDCILNSILNMGVKSPISLPLRHAGPILEVTGEVVHSVLPSVQRRAAEPTARINFCDTALPFIHATLKFGIVHQSKMLVEMVLPIESSLLDGLLLAANIVVGFQVTPIWISCRAEDATKYTILLRYTAMRRTSPRVEDEVHGFFMALPIVLGGERVSTEGTLEGTNRPSLLLVESVDRYGGLAATTTFFAIH